MKVKELLSKFPKIMEMEVDGLEFIYKGTESNIDETNEVIASFTKISNTKYTAIISTLPQNLYKEFNPEWSKRNNNNVIFSIKNGILKINDKINGYTASYKIESENYLKIAHEIMYYAYMRDDITHNKFEAYEGDRLKLNAAFTLLFGG